MVNYQEHQLDAIFAALSDPTRRALLARLAQDRAVPVKVLAQPFKMSLPAILKHLDVLAGAGLIDRQKTGRIVSCRLNAAPMLEAMDWLARYERFWTGQLDALARFLDQDLPEATPAPPSPHAGVREALHGPALSHGNANHEQTTQEQSEWPSKPSSTHQASPSNAGSTDRRKNATVHGRTRKR